ncbi:hypothetical protein MLD38_036150 [Melastoma candidum]|uniref:Uncharacterized protein n=1 Tax=Melastoma candidum TaxID=119954 RepID=A0ACB9LJ01_9MYRT|nr:hypothetical protein MLD38_036150 [Melastoma candidum]
MASSLASVVRGGSLLLTASSSSSGQSPCSLPSRVGLLVTRAPRALSGGLGVVSSGLLPYTRSTGGPLF